MMLSDFDKQSIGAILANEDRHYDWFSAVLLRFIARCGSEEQRGDIARVFPEHFNAVCSYLLPKALSSEELPAPFTTEEWRESLYLLFGKADMNNRARLEEAFPNWDQTFSDLPEASIW